MYTNNVYVGFSWYKVYTQYGLYCSTMQCDYIVDVNLVSPFPINPTENNALSLFSVENHTKPYPLPTLYLISIVILYIKSCHKW